MVYKKLKLEVKKFDLIETIYIYKKFKKELDENQVQYSHFAHYYDPSKDPHPIVRIKFDFIKDDKIVEQKGISIAEKLKNIEYKILDYEKWENADIEDWLILSHHLASECILILVDNPNYYNIIKNLPPRRHVEFLLTFFYLLMKKLFNVNLPIDKKYLSFIENDKEKPIFDAYVEDCKDRILSSSKEKIVYFAKPELNNGDLDFRERFIHFILLCSLMYNKNIEKDSIYPELARALNCNNSWELMQKICSEIKKKPKIWLILIRIYLVKIKLINNIVITLKKTIVKIRK